MSRFSVTALQLQGLVRMHRQRIGDARGFLSRLFHIDKIGNTAWQMDGSALLIIKGFAHGFQTLTDDAEFIYFHLFAYAPQAEGGLNPRDVRLGVDWPLVITEMSVRDAAHPLLDSQFKGLTS